MDMADLPGVKSPRININHLSDDLLEEIFIRLPLRSTVLCKCVSKRWLILISNPSFLRHFISHQQFLYKAVLIFLSPHELMLTFPPICEESSPPHNPNPSPSFPKLGSIQDETKTLVSSETVLKGNVCGCSNGLILCSDNRYTSGHGYFVYDPITKKRTVLPSTKTYEECIYAVGFVSDPMTHDKELEVKAPLIRSFRVVIIRSFILRLDVFEVEVFSSETWEWQEIAVNCPNGFAFAPHWLLSFEYEGCLYFMGRTSIFVYDPYSHESDTLDYPEDADPSNIMSFGFLGISCGTLRIADIGPNVVRVWQLIGNDQWQLVHSTNFSENLPAEFCAKYYKRIGGFHPHDGDIVYLYSYSDGVFVANLRANEFKAIPGYDKCDLSPFHLEMPLLPTLMVSSAE